MERLISYNKKIETKYRIFRHYSLSNHIIYNMHKRTLLPQNQYGDQRNSRSNTLEELHFLRSDEVGWK